MSAYVAVVPIIFNAAFAGAYAGMVAKRRTLDTVQADYAPVQAAASAFAQAVDTANGADAQLATAGASFVPTTAAQVNAQITKPAIMSALCEAYWLESSSTDATVADYNAAAAAIVAAYKNAISGTYTSAL